MVILALTFFAVSVMFRRLWNIVFDDPEPWASTLLPSAVIAVPWIFSTKWWLQRKSRRNGE